MIYWQRHKVHFRDRFRATIKSVGRGPIVLAVGAGGGCLDIFSLICQILFSFSLSLGDD